MIKLCFAPVTLKWVVTRGGFLEGFSSLATRGWWVSLVRARKTVLVLVVAVSFSGMALLAWRQTSLAYSGSSGVERHRLEVAFSGGTRGRDLVNRLARHAGQRVRVAVFFDEASCDAIGTITRSFEADPRLVWEVVGPEQVWANHLERFDVVVVAGGRAVLQSQALGEVGRNFVRRFTSRGGGFVGICAGAFLASAEYLGLVDVQPLTGDRELPGIGVVSMASRGPATIKMELTDAGRLVLGDLPVWLDVDFAGGPVFLGPTGKGPPPVALAYYRTEVSNYEPQRGTMVHSPAIVAGAWGRGRVVAISPHVERTPGLEFLVRRAILAVAREPDQAQGFERPADHPSSR